MKNVSTKIAYMVIGSILTLIGYHFGNIENNTAVAQRDDPIVDEIRSRRLVIVGDDDTPRVILGVSPNDSGRVLIGDENRELRLLLSAETSDGFKTGSIIVMTEDKKVAGVITSDMYGGYMAVHTRDGLVRKALAQMSTTRDGDGYVATRDQTDEIAGTIGGEKNKNTTEIFRYLTVFPNDEVFRQFRQPTVYWSKNAPRVDKSAAPDDDATQGDRTPDKILRKGDKIPPFNDEDCKNMMFITWNQSTIGEVKKNEIEFRSDGKSQIMLKDGTHYTSPNGCTIRDFTIISGSLEVYVPGDL